MITGSSSGLVETIADAVSIHSIKKAEYAKRLTSGRLGHVTLLDHFLSVSYAVLLHALTVTTIIFFSSHTGIKHQPNFYEPNGILPSL